MKGILIHELNANLSAVQLWEIYGAINFSKLVAELAPDLIAKVDILQGDGGVGTVVGVVFQTVLGVLFPTQSGREGSYDQLEKFVKIDHEKHMRETEVIEGGFLSLGFRFFMYRIEIIDKGNNSSLIKSSILYDVDEDHEASLSLVSVDPLKALANGVVKHIQAKGAIP